MTEATPKGLKAALGPKGVKSALRGAVTHVALICSDTSFQPRLPQILIGNKRRFTSSLISAAATSKPAVVHLMAEKTAWNTSSIMVRVLKLLGDALKPHIKEVQPVLLLDVAPCHLFPAVFEAAKANGVQLAFVPSRLTSTLQPLDVACFSNYKHYVRRGWMDLQKASPDGSVSNLDWLKLVMQAATSFLSSRRWCRSFEQVGVGGRANLGSDLTRQLPDASEVALLPGPPSPAELQLVFPRRRRPSLTQVVKIPRTVRRMSIKGPGEHAAPK